jgi:hypothetical protein
VKPQILDLDSYQVPQILIAVILPLPRRRYLDSMFGLDTEHPFVPSS